MTNKITKIKVPFYSKARIYFRFWKNFQQQIKKAQLGTPKTEKTKQVAKHEFILNSGKILPQTEKAKQVILDIAQRKRDMLKGSLTSEEVRNIVESQTETFTLEEAKIRFKDAINGITHKPYRKFHMQHKAVILLEPFLKKYHSEIKSIVNIGSGLDLIFGYLAPKYPDLNFTSLDFGQKLKEYNSVFPERENWNFVSGYALDLLRSGNLKADVYLTSSTSVRFNNKEMDLYIDEFVKYSKFVVINEGWWFQYGLKFPFPIVRPEEIPEDNSLIHGLYGDYHHNYIKKLEDRGFRIILSQIRDGSRYFAMQIIAENMNKQN